VLGTVLRETRVIWRKLDCLNPNLQKVKSETPVGMTPVTDAGPAEVSRAAEATSGTRSDAQ